MVFNSEMSISMTPLEKMSVTFNFELTTLKTSSVLCGPSSE